MNYNNSNTSKIGLCLVLFIIFIGVLYFAVHFTMHYMDLESVKQREFEMIVGTVVGFSSVKESNDPT